MMKVAMVRCGLALMSVILVSSAHAAGLCRADEAKIFNCDIKENKRIVSLCASKDLDASRGYLQYRYGVQNKVELEFPKYLSNSRDQFDYDQYSRPDLSTFVLGFNNDNYRYEISETTEGGDEGVTTRSLLVSSGKGNRASN